MVTRAPIAAGSFYEDDPNKLANQLTKAFKEGAGIPGEATNNKIIAAIVCIILMISHFRNC